MIEKARKGSLDQTDIPLAAAGFTEGANPYFSDVLKKLGPLTKLRIVNRSELGDDMLYTYEAASGDRAATVSLAVASDGRASSFIIEN